MPIWTITYTITDGEHEYWYDHNILADTEEQVREQLIELLDLNDKEFFKKIDDNTWEEKLMGYRVYQIGQVQKGMAVYLFDAKGDVAEIHVEETPHFTFPLYSSQADFCWRFRDDTFEWWWIFDHVIYVGMHEPYDKDALFIHQMPHGSIEKHIEDMLNQNAVIDKMSEPYRNIAKEVLLKWKPS